MCNMQCGICGYCELRHRIALGIVFEKERYCNLYDMWISEIVRQKKLGIF